MKHITQASFFLLTLFMVTMSFGQVDDRPKVLYIKAVSEDSIAQNKLDYIVDEFQNELLFATKRYQISAMREYDDNAYATARATEIISNIKSNDVNPKQLKDFGQLLGVDEYCLIVVTKQSDDYYFSVKIFEIETGNLKSSASYPRGYGYSTDIPIRDLSNRDLVQRTCQYLISRLNILEDAQSNYDEQLSRQDTLYKKRLDKIRESEDNKRKLAEKTARRNRTAMFFHPMYAYYMEFGGAQRSGFQIATGFDIKWISLGGGIYIGANRDFPIKSDKDLFNEKYVLGGASAYVYGGINFKYFGFGIKPIFYSLRRDFSGYGSYKGGRYDDEVYDAIVNKYSRTIIGLSPCIRVHIPLTTYGNEPLFGLSCTLGYILIPSIGYNPGIDCSIGFSLFWH